MPSLPKKAVKLEDLICKKCGKTLKECPPSQCEYPDCPNKPKEN